MIIPLLVMLAVLFLVLTFVSVVTLKVGIIIVAACLILTFVLSYGNARGKIF